MAKHILERLADAGEAEEGMFLSADDVHELLSEIIEIDETRELDDAMFRFILDTENKTQH